MNFTPTLPDWYTTAEVMQLFGWSTRAQVSAAAKSHGWQRRMIGRAALYAALDVETYGMARLRRQLLNAMGATGSALIWHDEHDIPCPMPDCDQFAVGYNGRWRCAAGHEGKTDK